MGHTLNLNDKLAVTAYLMAGVIANAFVTRFGQAGLVVTALLMIPVDLTVRDYLHERWERSGALNIKMWTLILSGALLSYWSSFASREVAIASCAAFLCSGAADFFIFKRLRGNTWFVRANLSNLGSAAVDSFVFPAVAFSVFDVRLCAVQTLLKFFGGLVISNMMAKRMGRPGLW